jgi:hypothetical protein
VFPVGPLTLLTLPFVIRHDLCTGETPLVRISPSSTWHLRLLVALLAVLLLAVPVSADLPANRKIVLALYYPWYDHGTWNAGITSDRPMVTYSSGDRAAIDRHVGWAREAGIDALVSAWFGPRDDNPTESNFRALLDAAGQEGPGAALLLETNSEHFFPDRGAIVDALRHALTVHAEHPAYLKVGGRPVIFVWSPSSLFGPDGGRAGPSSVVSAWRSLLDEVDPERRALWIAEGEATQTLDVFDGIFPYWIAWSPDPARQLATYGQRVRDYNARTGNGKLWIATAMPGYDDTRAPGRARGFAVDRADGAYYRTTFGGAIASRPDWIVITSFNEWVEGSQIEPAASYRTHYLELTKELAALFKGT